MKFIDEYLNRYPQESRSRVISAECPFDRKYDEKDCNETDISCKECWEREMPIGYVFGADFANGAEPKEKKWAKNYYHPITMTKYFGSNQLSTPAN